jgi:nitronate monooxygenase
MTLPKVLDGRLRLPAIGAPMFLVSGPELVIAQCKAGIVGAFPALNARPLEQLDEWLAEIGESLGAEAAPFAVNLIVHRTNSRVERELALCEKHRVPLVITSLGARADVIQAVKAYGGTVLHDIISLEHAHKAADRGVDGLIAVAQGAGGHAGRLSPFALVQEIRLWWQGPLVLSGAIATGGAILAAEAMGADLAYLGSPFIATEESRAQPDYKAMVVAAAAEDIVYTKAFSGVHGNYLKPSVRAAGFDPDNLAGIDRQMNLDQRTKDGPQAWRDIWSAGQGVGAVTEILPVAALVDRLEREYRAARERLGLPAN